MNPNMPYGPHMPMHPPQRRHDGSYVAMPPHMRPHPGYQPYYQPPMAPMLGPYPPPYAQNWYPYQQHHMPQPLPPHAPRGAQFYPQGPPMPMHMQPPAMPPHHAGQVPPRPMPGPPPPLVHQSSSATVNTVSTPVKGSPSPQPSVHSVGVTQPTESSRASSPATAPIATQAIELEPSDRPFHPPVPWLSVSDTAFPPRAPRRKRKITRSALATEPIEFPLDDSLPDEGSATEAVASVEAAEPEIREEEPHSITTPIQTPTPLTSDAASEGLSTQPTTPSSVVPVPYPNQQQTPTQTKVARHVAPVLPAIPILPPSPTATRKPHRDSALSATSKEPELLSAQGSSQESSGGLDAAIDGLLLLQSETIVPPTSPPVPPKSWADLVRSKAIAANLQQSTTLAQIPNGLTLPKSESLSEVLADMNSTAVDQPSKLALLQPRGLVNTGNMCYMNSILQMLVFCVPFYEFLDKIAHRATHAFKSDTPMIDAMIMFMREYPTIVSAPSVEQLRLRLKPDDFEKYGDPFIPEYVYQVIRQLPRFRDMRRGHQQDAQEFLGFLLEELHEECAVAMRSGSGRSTPVGSSSVVSEQNDTDDGWMEVGHKQKAAITRSSGAIANDSPVTNIFGGKLRSEFKVAGNKLSVTLEPYQPLQLDIGSPHINNIVDALKGLTRPESVQGDFESARGNKATATKQVFIETLPPVLILHLKRFQYDNTTKRAEKIWKKVGYPLDLEIPKEVFPAQARNKLATYGGLPKYRLTGVIYHHGKHANGGHYTVDIRRQDGKEWIRVDDTLIRRVRHEDVAEGGSEEDPKVLAAALERHKQQKPPNNRFEQIEHETEEEDGAGKVWNQVNGHARNKSTMSTAVNGAATPGTASSGLQTPNAKSSLRDNKVAYLLFYQRTS